MYGVGFEWKRVLRLPVCAACALGMVQPLARRLQGYLVA